MFAYPTLLLQLVFSDHPADFSFLTLIRFLAVPYCPFLCFGSPMQPQFVFQQSHMAVNSFLVVLYGLNLFSASFVWPSFVSSQSCLHSGCSVVLPCRHSGNLSSVSVISHHCKPLLLFPYGLDSFLAVSYGPNSFLVVPYGPDLFSTNCVVTLAGQ